jgi:hypothetical protein
VETEQDSRCNPGIADDETGEELAIRSAVAGATDLYRVFIKTRRLEEYPLLGLPKKSQQSEQQPDRNEGGNHIRTVRGFQ